MNTFIKSLAACAALTLSAVSQATIVEVQTSQGTFNINLYDKATPITVANFLNYAQSEKYNDVIIHRVVPGFVVQGGGVIFNDEQKLELVEANAPIKNEPKYSNVRGTIAMAKLANDPDSATNQWFINLADNSANLDLQNGGFTVFGEVVGDGMAVVDKIAGLSLCGSMPLVNFSAEQCADPTIQPVSENAVTIYSVAVVDSNVDSASGLTPKENTLINKQDNKDESSSGGALFAMLLGLCGLVLRRVR
jgi:peptidyl-prolyl cis-trans isomerase A (cyclophilin A)